jgi:hypothetical protein
MKLIGARAGGHQDYPAARSAELRWIAVGEGLELLQRFIRRIQRELRHADGTLALLVINKSPQAALRASFSIAGFRPQSEATVYSYGIPQDEAARTRTGSPDIATSTFAGVASSFNYTFAPYSATVIALASGGSCAFSVEAQFGKFKSLGGSGNLTVTAGAGCAWQASSAANWITITSGETGTGSGVVSTTVAPNDTGVKRKGRLTIAGQVFVVIQKG